MKYKIIFSKNAKEDLFCIVRYTREKLLSPSSAEKLAKRILESIKTLDEMPMRCRLCEYEDWKSLGLRFLPVDNYLIFYLLDEEQKLVKIYRIMYGKRDIKNQLLEENITFD
ncbi:type II toxin-antitoxin system RelE/ParE family toxin [Peptostreptococcus porci]|uniref:type II toxin-antitoxin system RelE/ParE family toxin n=1 Tax=Peptostreptococcus porci TaxID=2652282 RepID=UPI0023F0333C|nr:type II toxin-antitoxin system RelE/ParE family toxin [Peptostreptococcus porci]MDD7182876.1 type II toxin-antitoxin system RelE/ParE family toxin [Peptostreptococcus porci]MDY5964376.1 type II toxin-antitoxin system RelE/ParE family toxin [Peptostreptococcus porci]